MLALARHVLGDRALAEDPVQDVFQNAFRALPTVSFCSYGTSKNMTRTIFELHSRVCRECRDYLAAYRRTTELRRAAMLCPSDRVADDVPQVLIKAVLKSLR